MKLMVFLAAVSIARGQVYQFGKGGSLDIEGLLLTLKDSDGKTMLQTRSQSLPFIVSTSESFNKNPVNEGSYNLHVNEDVLSTYQNISKVIQADPNTYSLTGMLYGGQLPSACALQYAMDITQVTSTEMHFSVVILSVPEGCQTAKPNAFNLIYSTTGEEAFYGFGEQYSFWNLKGQKIPVIVSEQGIGRGRQPITDILNGGTSGRGAGGNPLTTYAPKNLYITTSDTALILETGEVIVFDLASDENSVTVQYPRAEIPLKGRLYSGSSPLELITQITTFTGRMKPVPEWTLSGAILGIEGGEDIVLKGVNYLLERDVPLVGVWMQDWCGSQRVDGGVRLVWNWELDYKLYPNWKNMTATWKQKGIKPLVYINPNLEEVKDDQVRHNQFKEAKAKGFFIKDSEGNAIISNSGSIRFGKLDLANPAAYNWTMNLIKENLIEEAGAYGYMCDFGEYLAWESQAPANKTVSAYHNEYPDYWAKVNYDGTASLRGDIMYFMRSAWLKAPSHTPMFWLGDQLTSWDEHDGLKTTLLAIFNAGISGHSLQHSDIGGYTNVPGFGISRSKELLMRWSELSAFSDSVFRLHPGLNQSANWQPYDDDASAQHFKKFATVHKLLGPYKLAIMKNDVQEKGWPMSRHLYLHYPKDTVVRTLTEQFMLGHDLIVAPVLNPNTTSVKLYLPSDDAWVNMWTGADVQPQPGTSGQTVSVASEIGFPAAFCRSGSAVCSLIPEFKKL